MVENTNSFLLLRTEIGNIRQGTINYNNSNRDIGDNADITYSYDNIKNVDYCDYNYVHTKM